MGRWRPPSKRGASYITQQGYETLRNELNELWKVERPIVTDAVREAAKNGDRSENGDYIYGKKRLREIDRRVRYLSKRLEELSVVKEPPADINKIYFGAWVTLEDDEGKLHNYQIVGPDEFDISQNKISIDSPFAKALLGKSIDDEALIHSPKGEQAYYVIAISYAERADTSNE